MQRCGLQYSDYKMKPFFGEIPIVGHVNQHTRKRTKIAQSSQNKDVCPSEKHSLSPKEQFIQDLKDEVSINIPVENFSSREEERRPKRNSQKKGAKFNQSHSKGGRQGKRKKYVAKSIINSTDQSPRNNNKKYRPKVQLQRTSEKSSNESENKDSSGQSSKVPPTTDPRSNCRLYYVEDESDDYSNKNNSKENNEKKNEDEPTNLDTTIKDHFASRLDLNLQTDSMLISLNHDLVSIMIASFLMLLVALLFYFDQSPIATMLAGTILIVIYIFRASIYPDGYKVQMSLITDRFYISRTDRDLRNDNMRRVDLKHKDPHINIMHVRYNKQFRHVKGMSTYCKVNFEGENCWTEQKRWYSKDIVRELHVSAEIFCQVKHNRVFRMDVALPVLWEKISYACENVNSVNLNRYYDADVVTDTILYSYYYAISLRQQTSELPFQRSPRVIE